MNKDISPMLKSTDCTGIEAGALIAVALITTAETLSPRIEVAAIRRTPVEVCKIAETILF